MVSAGGCEARTRSHSSRSAHRTSALSDRSAIGRASNGQNRSLMLVTTMANSVALRLHDDRHDHRPAAGALADESTGGAADVALEGLDVHDPRRQRELDGG